MTVHLVDRITDLQQELNPPGQTVIAFSDDEALQRLVYAFWDLRLSGLDMLAAFTCDDSGNISRQPGGGPPALQQNLPVGWYTDDGTGDLGREIQAAIVLWAGHRAILTQYLNLKTLVSSRAGPVSFEVQQSAQVLQAVLRSVTAKMDIVLTRLSDLGSTTVTVLDAVIDNTTNLANADTWWVR